MASSALITVAPLQSTYSLPQTTLPRLLALMLSLCSLPRNDGSGPGSCRVRPHRWCQSAHGVRSFRTCEAKEEGPAPVARRVSPTERTRAESGVTRASLRGRRLEPTDLDGTTTRSSERQQGEPADLVEVVEERRWCRSRRPLRRPPVVREQVSKRARLPGALMNLVNHRNASLTPQGRLLLSPSVESGRRIAP